MLRRTLIGLVVICSSHVFAAETVEGIKSDAAKIEKALDKCMADAVSNAEMGECSSQKFQSADALLNRVYKAQVAVLKKQIQEEKGEGPLGDATALNTREWRHAGFFNRVKEAVAAKWDPMRRNPKLTPRDRTTVLGVTLRPDGTIGDLFVTESSGIEALDIEAMQAFERAAPFPNPPAALVHDGFIRFAFSFNVMNQVPGWRF